MIPRSSFEATVPHLRAQENTWSWFRPVVTVAVAMLVATGIPFIAIDGQWNALLATTTSPALVKLQLWVALVAVQVLCWLVILIWCRPHLVRLYREVGNVPAVLVRCVLPVLLLLTPWLAAAEINQTHRFPPATIGGVTLVPIVGTIGLVVAAITTCGLYLVFLRAQYELAVDQPPHATAFKLGQLTRLLHQFLFAAAIVLALGIVGTAAMLQAARASYPDQYNFEFVIVFGIAGSIFLMAAYAPLRLMLFRFGTDLRDRILGPAPEATADLGNWLNQRDALDRLLGQDTKSAFGLGGIATTLLPLVVSALSKLLG